MRWLIAVATVTAVVAGARPAVAGEGRPRPRELERAAALRIPECEQVSGLPVRGGLSIGPVGKWWYALAQTTDPITELHEKAADPEAETFDLARETFTASVVLAQCLFGVELEEYPKGARVTFVVLARESPNQESIEVTRKGMRALVRGELTVDGVYDSYTSGSTKLVRVLAAR